VSDDDESAYRSALRGPGSRPDYRRLTPEQSLAFRDAMAPLLRDLAVSGELAPELADRSWDDGQDVVSGFIYQPGLGGWWGIRVQVTWPEADRVVNLAGQVQEWAVEALWTAARSATWPECPEHPNSHPLAPTVDGADAAVWRCPASNRVVSAIGKLKRRA
jgi:hypothetical protein